MSYRMLEMTALAIALAGLGAFAANTYGALVATLLTRVAVVMGG